MKAVLISIQPKWCELIASGKKTVEIRKTKPKIETPFKCYIYCTKGKSNSDFITKSEKFGYLTGHEGSFYNRAKEYDANGKVIGVFVCDEIVEYEGEFYDEETQETIKKVIHTTDWDGYPEIDYNFIAENGEENSLCKSSCVSWEELRNYMGAGINTFFGWHISGLVIYDKPRSLGEFYNKCKEMACEGCEHLKYQQVNSNECDYDCEYLGGNIPMSRAPQSWCYIEEGGE